MGAGDFLRRLTAALDTANMPYMLTGSLASALHGEPRATQDIDLVVELGASGRSGCSSGCPTTSTTCRKTRRARRARAGASST